MSDAFKVDLEELDDVVARLAQLDKILSEHLRQIDRRVAALHESSWHGVAAQAHGEAHRKWSAGAKRFHEGVTEIRAVAHNAHTQYTRAQSVNRRMLR